VADVEVGRVTIRVSPDTDRFRGDTKRGVESELAGYEADVPVEADTDFSDVKPKAAAAAKAAKQKVRFEAEGRDYESALKRLKNQSRELRNEMHAINWDMANQQGDQKALRNRADLVRQAQTYNALQLRDLDNSKKLLKVDKKRVGMMAGMMASFRGVQMPSFGSGINPAGWVAILAAVALFAAPLIGLVTAAVMALPGLIALVAAPIGALALGMDGLKYAAEQVKVPFENLKEAMSAKTAEVFTPIFESLIPLMEHLEVPLQKVVDGLGVFTTGITEALLAADESGQLDAIFTGIGQALADMKPGIEGFTSGILGLIEGLVGEMGEGGFADWFNETGKAFSNWIKEMSESGELSETFKSLGDFLKLAADFLGQLALSGLEYITDPTKMQGFLDTIERITTALEKLVGLANDLPDLNTIFNQALPDIGDGSAGGILDGIGDDLVGTLNFGNSRIGRLLNGEIGWGDFFNPLTNAAETAAQDVDKIQVDPVDPDQVAKNLDAMALLAAQTASDMQDDFTDVFSGGMFSGEVPVEADIADTIGSTVHDRIVDQVSTAIDDANARMSLLGAAIDEQITGVLEPLNAIPGKVTNALLGLAPAFQSGFAPMVIAAATAVQNVNIALGAGFAQIPGLVTRSFAGVAGAAETSMGLMVTAVATGTQNVVTEVGKMPPLIVAAFDGLPALMRAQGAALVDGLVSGILGNMDRAVNAARTLAAATAAGSASWWGISSPAAETEEQGKYVVQGFVEGLHGNAYLAQKAMEEALTPNDETKKAIRDGQKSLEDVSGVPGIAPGSTEEMMNGMGWTEGEQQRLEKINNEYKDLGRTLKYLKQDLLASDAAGDVAIQQEIDHIKELRKKIKLEKDYLDLQKEASGVKEKNNKEDKSAGDYLNDAISAGKDFAMANADQFASDLGISGSGAISQGINEGLNWAMGAMSNLVSSGMGGMGGNIVVNNVDDAVAAKNNQVNKQKKQYATR